MGKILGSFSGMRKYLEKERLAPALRGRVRYGCTTYVGMDGCRVFDVFVDGKSVKRFSLETVNSYFIAQGYAEKKSPMSIPEYWNSFWPLLSQYPMSQRTEYSDDEFCAALKAYRSQPIQESLSFPDPIVRMFACLDKRIGVRTLRKLRADRDNQPQWLRFFYDLRLEETRL